MVRGGRRGYILCLRHGLRGVSGVGRSMLLRWRVVRWGRRSLRWRPLLMLLLL